MIDLHVHVLPGVDDGARDLAMSRQMFAQMAAFGFERVVATPHLMEPLAAEYALRVEAALDATREVAAEFSIELDQGYELMLTPAVTERLLAGEQSTLAGSRTVLVELPFVGWPQHAESTLFSLQVAGYVPVLAHPERYVDVHKDAELALAVASRGVGAAVDGGGFCRCVWEGCAAIDAGVAGGRVEARSADDALDGRALGRAAADVGAGWVALDPGACVRRSAVGCLADVAVPAFALSTAGAPERSSLWRRVTGRT